MAVNPKVITEEMMRDEIAKAVEAERKKFEKANSGYEIIAPVADPNHPNWQARDDEGKLTNPFKEIYADEYGTFKLQVAPFIAKDGREYPPSEISMFRGRGFTSDKNVADWVKMYYGYAIRQVKAKDETQRALELASV